MKRLVRGWALGVVLVALMSAQPNAPAQAAAPAHAQARHLATAQKSIRVEVNLVNVLATVTDKRGRMVLNLGQDNFRLFEDHQPQIIRFFTRETDSPLRIGVLIDTSNSIAERLHFEQEAAIEFLQEAIRPGKDKAFVVGFDVEPQILQDYTDDVDKLSTAIRGLAAGGGTALYDALYDACEKKMLTLPPTEPYLRRVLIVVSDGRDNESEYSREDALSMAQKAEAAIYAISTNNSGANATLDTERGSGGLGDKTLKYLAEKTGGRAFFPFEASDLTTNFQEIARELRSQYSLAYISSNPKRDGTFRTIDLETNRKGLHVRAKTGYFAPTQ